MSAPKRDKPIILTGFGDKSQVNVMLLPLQELFPNAVIKDEGGTNDFCKQALSLLPDVLVFGPVADAEEGLEVLRRFPRATRPFRIVIALNAAQESARKACLDAGADDIVLRPITEPSDRTVLHAKVQTLLSGQYVSELPFLSAAGTLGAIGLKCTARIVQISDREVKFHCSASLLKGGRGVLELGTIGIVIIGVSADYNANKSYLVTARVDSILRGDWADLRRAILLLTENQAVAAKR